MRVRGSHTYISKTGEAVDIATMPTAHLIAAYRKGMTLMTINERTAAAMRIELDRRGVSRAVILAPIELSAPQAISWASTVFSGHKVTSLAHKDNKTIGVQIGRVLYSGCGDTWLAALQDLMDRTGRMPTTKEQP